MKPTDDPSLREAATLVREIPALIIDHEKREHDGARCSDERANMLAFLGHVLMLNGNEWIQAMEIAAEYMKNHPTPCKE